MELFVEILTTVGILVAVLCILVFFHELGHFLAAKFFGMRVERFSVGFPPRIWGIKKGETDYCIGATPLGGYVKISGMIDESMDTDYLDKEPEPYEFRSKPVWQRIIVIVAGVIFNMILAAIIFAVMGMTTGEVNIPVESINGIYVAEDSYAAQVGFQTGDELVAVNGQEVQYFKEFFAPAQLTADQLSYTVLRNGERVQINMPADHLDKMKDAGFIGPHLNNVLPSQISRVVEGSPADSAGLQAGDKIIAVNGEPVNYFLGLVEKIENAGQTTVEEIENTEQAMFLTIKRNGSIIETTVTPNEEGNLGIYSPNPQKVFVVEHVKYGFFEAIPYGIEKTKETTVSIIQGFAKLFSGDISVRENLGGPVAIANLADQATDQGGWYGFWRITAFLSVTLAIMNILPVPALDGGHLMFLIYEGITRREPSEKVRMALQQIGFVLLVGLIILITFNDILRLF